LSRYARFECLDVNRIKLVSGRGYVDTLELVVDDEADGQRLDRWLTGMVEDLSRSRLQALIAEGHIKSGDGQIVSDASKKVRNGQRYILSVPPPAPAEPHPEDIPLQVIFEDDHLIVIDKPIGLVVHPSAGHASGTLVNALLHHCAGSLSGIGGVTRPGIVHRLDKDTSGIMVCAKSDRAHQGLAEQFQVHSIERSYRAVVWGMPSPRTGRIEANIGRDPKNRKRMAIVHGRGKHAITDYEVVKPVGSLAALVDCHLFTGRTHQIRVHMKSIGHPLIGDPVYAAHMTARKIKDPVIRRDLGTYNSQALQAYKLGFIHPITSEQVRFEAKISYNISYLINKIESL